MQITKAKKRGFASIMIAALLLPLIWTVMLFATTGSYVEATTKTTLVNNDELYVEATSTTRDNQICWQINYQQKNVSATNQQRLKFMIDKGDGLLKTSDLQNQNGFEDGNVLTDKGWIMDKHFMSDQLTNTGYVAFLTNKSANKIRATLQADRKVQPTDNTIVTPANEKDDENSDDADADADADSDIASETKIQELELQRNVLSN